VPHPGAGDVHLWFTSLVPLSWAPRAIENMMALLTHSEMDRVRRGINATVRNRALGSRASLRRLLGSLLEMPPAMVPIETGANGRPFVPGASFDFNVSHTADMMVIAVTGRGPIGVDLETVAEFEGMRDIAQTRFDADTALSIARADDRSRAELFHRAWTALEAVLKADGAGLTAEPQIGEMTVTSFTGPGGTVGSVATAMRPERVIKGLLAPV
jgi:4'-phosphopantetheinyl transferase